MTAASELTAEQAIANYLATGRTPIFEPYPLPVVSRANCRTTAIPYWGEPATCPCCGESRARRFIDHQRGDLGQCHACQIDLTLASAPRGGRCAAHRRWDAKQAARSEGRRSA